MVSISWYGNGLIKWSSRTFNIIHTHMLYVIPSMGYCTFYSKMACFVLYLKIINTTLKNNVSNVNCLRNKLFKGLKNGIEILVGQAVF